MMLIIFVIIVIIIIILQLSTDTRDLTLTYYTGQQIILKFKWAACNTKAINKARIFMKIISAIKNT